MTELFSHLVWVGAGQALVPSGLTERAKQITLVDAREDACLALQTKAFKSAVTIKQLLITADGMTADFTEYNLPEYSSIRPSPKLQEIFPGLKEERREKKGTTKITSFVSDLKLSDHNNVLVLDTVDTNFSLIKSLEENQQLHLFKELYVAVGTEPLYTEKNRQDITSFLQQHGYLLLEKTITCDNPDFAWLSFTSNPLWSNLQQIIRSKVLLEKECEALKAERAALNQELFQKNKALQEKDTQIQFGNDFEQKFQKMFADQSKLLTDSLNNVKNNLSWSIGNVPKQIESFIGIQNYLEKGIKPLSFHGWPISPDIGLYIIGLIDSNNYDVIIEFGSGTSTVMMAKALISKHSFNKNKQPISTRLLTFEHNNIYYDKTAQALQDAEVEHLVDLAYAPLVDYQYQDEKYLYYSCNEKLQELAKNLKGRKANILVLVDGPPGATNKNARFPALPHLLNLLPEHSFTIIMDDYNRAEEKEIVNIWKKISEERYMDISIEEMKCEKGCSTISINCKD